MLVYRAGRGRGYFEDALAWSSASQRLSVRRVQCLSVHLCPSQSLSYPCGLYNFAVPLRISLAIVTPWEQVVVLVVMVEGAAGGERRWAYLCEPGGVGQPRAGIAIDSVPERRPGLRDVQPEEVGEPARRWHLHCRQNMCACACVCACVRACVRGGGGGG